MKIIVFDTETTGFPSPSLPIEQQPYICQFAAIQLDCDLQARQLTEIQRIDQLIKPAVSIPSDCTSIHGISDMMVANSPTIREFADQLVELFRSSDVAVAHNLDFDRKVIENELIRLGRPKQFLPMQLFDTMEAGVDVCKLPGGKSGFKYPKLLELHQHFFHVEFDGAHNAMNDVIATARVMREFLKLGTFQPTEPTQRGLF